MKIPKAVRTLTTSLKKDEGFWYTYQSTIAMSFYDAVLNYRAKTKNRSLSNKTIHKLSNDAANNFLKLWTESK